MDRINFRNTFLIFALGTLLAFLPAAVSSGEEQGEASIYEEPDLSYEEYGYESDYEDMYGGEDEDDLYEDESYDEESEETEEVTEVRPAAPVREPAPSAASVQVETNLTEGWPVGPDIDSGSAILLETETGTMLYAKDPYAPLDPGSTVKIMTVLLALENSRMDDQVTMTETGIYGVTDGGLNISAQLDETFTMEQCLYAIMLASANEISIQVAEHLGGTVDNFVRMMNTRAEELGCVNTNFTNPTGLEDPSQISCAHDMALIMQAATKNESFLSIAKTPIYTIPATNMSEGDRVLSNSFSMLSSNSGDYYEGCLGGKQGFTETAGTTLVCAAKKDEMTLICAVLQGKADTSYQDAVYLLDYGFEDFRLDDISKQDFDIISGGTVILPYDGDFDDLTYESVTQGENVVRTYLFHESIPVGTAIAQITKVEENLDVALGEQYLEEAKAFSENKSKLPYYLIGAAGLAVLIILIRMLMKTLAGKSDTL